MFQILFPRSNKSLHLSAKRPSRTFTKVRHTLGTFQTGRQVNSMLHLP